VKKFACFQKKERERERNIEIKKLFAHIQLKKTFIIANETTTYVK